MPGNPRNTRVSLHIKRTQVYNYNKVYILSTGYMNASSPRVGYYACTLSSLCGAALLFLVGWGRRNPCSPVIAAAAAAAAAAGGGGGGSLGSVPCACSAGMGPMTPVARTLTRLPKSQSLHIPLNRSDMQHSTPMAHGHAAMHPGHMGSFQRNSFYACTPQHYHEQQIGKDIICIFFFFLTFSVKCLNG